VSVSAPIYLVKGEDESLVRDRVREIVDELVGDGDRSLMVEELSGDDYELRSLVDAAQTPPFLTGRRVVVGRDVHRFSTAEAVGPLVTYLADPLETTALVAVWTSGRVPKPLLDALKAAGGEQIDASPGHNAKAQRAWLDDHVAASGLKLDSRATKLLADRLGEDVGRLSGVLATLESTFGAGAKLGEDDIEPYVGEAGGIAPWELTDAIDKGDITTALDKLHRMHGPGGRHALQLMATVHGHYGRMLALDGSEVRSEKEAAALLGLRGSTFPAKKALDQVRRLGHDRLTTAFGLLAQADRDLRGEKGYPREVSDSLVMEVLVARLANLSSAAR
jgi:DNA polymerase-3 subunit delta